jgi:putative permease
MALLVGMSILVPYLGAFLVTIPVLLLGYSSLGLSENFLILILSYCGIQIFDANILFPLIFTGIIKTSSLTILISILFFGTIYGVPGAFFAIPLIVVIKSIYMNWPYAKDK